MPVRKKINKIYRRKIKGGADIPESAPAPQLMQNPQIPQEPIAVQQPAPVAKSTLISFPKKIRLKITPELNTVIEAPEEAEYILSERLNAASKYGNPDVYIAQFGQDEETQSPIDVYTAYVYERLKDMNKNDCQTLKFRGDKAEPGGFLSSATTRRQTCTKNVSEVKKDDNRILKLWIDNINTNGVKFMESVGVKLDKLQEELKDLESLKMEKESELKDATNTLNDNIKGIDRETQQRLSEITRVIQDKEENMGDKIDAEITDLQNFIKEETNVISEIEKLDKEIFDIIDQGQQKQKELEKIQKGLNNTMLQLSDQGIDLDKLVQTIERSIQMYAMVGGKRKRKMKRGGSIMDKVKKMTSKTALSGAVGAAAGVALLAGKRRSKKGGSLVGSTKKIVKKVISKKALGAAVGAAAGVALLTGGKRKRKTKTKSKKKSTKKSSKRKR